MVNQAKACRSKVEGWRSVWDFQDSVAWEAEAPEESRGEGNEGAHTSAVWILVFAVFLLLWINQIFYDVILLNPAESTKLLAWFA